jgi:hypothetical protein
VALIANGRRLVVGTLLVVLGLLVPNGVGFATSAGASPVGVPTQLAITSQPRSTVLLNQPFFGYWMTGSDGGVFALGGAPYEGSLPGVDVTVNDIVGMAATPTGRGYWLVGADGGVFAFGDAPYLGSLPGDGTAVSDVVGIDATPNGNGYWLVGSNGAVYPFGISRFEGSLPDLGVTVHDIVGMAATPTGMGYWLVGADGGVFAFGDAPFMGSMVGLGQHVTNAVGIAGTSDGAGYWVATAAGAVAGFGSAGNFPGSPLVLNAPVSSITPTFSASSYWLFGKDGGVFAYGGAPYEGSLRGLGVHVTDIVGSAAL